MHPAPIQLPLAFGADPQADLFFQEYVSDGAIAKTHVVSTHHLISLLKEGEKEIHMADQHIRMDASRLFLLSAGSSIMSVHHPRDGAMRSLLLFFSPAFLEDFCARQGLHPRGDGERLVPLQQDEFTQVFVKSVGLLKAHRLNRNPALQHAKMEEILLYLLAHQPQGMESFLARALHQSHELPLRQVVLRHQHSLLSLAELAFLCNMSVSTFKRRFQETFHTTPGKYFHDLRMARAAELLSQHHRPSEIFHQLGYESLSAFSAEFKKHHGVSPKEWQPQDGLPA